MLLDGRTLDLKKVANYLLQRDEVRISKDAIQSMRRFRNRLEERLRKGEQIYGITTGFGILAKKRIDNESEMQELQRNLVRSHAAGAGKAMRDDVVKVAMLVKLNSLLRGNSCVRPEVAVSLAGMLNKDIIPIVPIYGSLGASGDLAPSAYVALAMIGEGQVSYKGKATHSSDALNKSGMHAIALQPKEGLSLLNGTCFTTAFACIAAIELNNLLSWANTCVALTSEALHACSQSFDERLMNLRGQIGQIEVAKSIRKLLEGSERLREEPIPQDPYCIRCAPQVHGSVLESYFFAAEIINRELNGITDNPVMSDDGEILHGGNFHAQPIAMVLDLLAISSTYISELSLARVHRLMDASISEKRDYFAGKPGLESGLMLTEYLAVSLNNANSVLLHPASSYPAMVSAGIEDHASHGVNAGLKAVEIISNVSRVLAIEMICLSNFLGDDDEGLSKASRLMLKHIRKFSPLLKGDRSLGNEIEMLSNELRRSMPPSMNI